MFNKEFYKDATIKDIINSKDMGDMNIQDFVRWLNTEQCILDDTEKRYLRCLVLPFYNRVEYVIKSRYDNNETYIKIRVRSLSANLESESILLPIFTNDNMYVGMEYGKPYTLRKLGIFK